MDPTRYTPFFFRHARHLWCEGARLDRIAARLGTPVYVYSRASIEDAYRRLDHAFGSLPHALCYSVNANSNLAILRLLANLGSWFDIVSGGELYRLRRVGVPGRRIVFSCVGKTAEEIGEALRERILLLNVE
jgi:diaminopimelate decarboxylase